MPFTEKTYAEDSLHALRQRELGLFDPAPERFVRVCLRCGQKMNGYGFYTHYGPLIRPDGTRVHGCGEAVHHHCPHPTSGPRFVDHDPSEFGEPVGRRSTHKVAPGVDEILGTGRYAARVKNHRLGTYDTFDEAEQARNLYLREMESTARRKKQKEQHENPKRNYP